MRVRQDGMHQRLASLHGRPHFAQMIRLTALDAGGLIPVLVSVQIA